MPPKKSRLEHEHPQSGRESGFTTPRLVFSMVTEMSHAGGGQTQSPVSPSAAEMLPLPLAAPVEDSE